MVIIKNQLSLSISSSKMKRFLLNGLGLFILLLIANFFLFKVVYRIYLEEYEKVETTFSTYILSDSHGVPLKQLLDQAEVYNFSAVSDSYIDMERKLSFLITNTKVKRILITVDDHTLSTYREDGNNTDRSAFFAETNNFSNQYDFLRAKYLRYYIVFFNAKYQSLLKPYVLSRIFRVDKRVAKSDQWSDLSGAKREELSLDRFNGQFKERQKSEILKKSLEKIISICKSNDIELTGIKYPISESYFRLVGDKTYNAEGLFLEHGLRVLDYKKLYLKNPDFFENQDHLNFEGGSMFFRYLVEKL
ncbi:MAG: hypothetical protein ACI9QN_002812 [Arcticibacterium sp.]